jgi:undecaprenyl-diphosphatase
MSEPISPFAALLLGIVEGLTEFLPVSSTGHLILTSVVLGLDMDDAGIEAFLVVIQVGALLAVTGRYRRAVGSMMKGLAGRDHAGLRLFGLLLLGFLPVVPVALLLADPIKERLFAPIPVALALAAGGVAMILLDRRVRARETLPGGAGTVPGDGDSKVEAGAGAFASLPWTAALIIGVAQCLSLWPGTSRAMVTILAGLMVGLRPRAAAEFSFLLALPTLGAATAYDLMKNGPAIVEASGWGGLAIGFGVSCVVATLAMKYFLQFLAVRGLAPFGWYRIILAFVIFAAW